MIQLPSRNAFLHPSGYSQLFCDGKRRIGMIACNHNGGYPRPRKALHGSHSFRPDRILHADKAEKQHPFFPHASLRRHRKRQHAPAFPHKPFLYPDQPVALFPCQLRRFIPPADIAAIFQNPLRRPFRVRNFTLPFPVQRRHHLPFRVKTILCKPRMSFPDPLYDTAAIRRHMKKGKLRRVSDSFFPRPCVIAQHTPS